MNIKLTPEQLDDAVIYQLRWALPMLKNMMEERLNGTSLPYKFKNVDEDVAEIKSIIDGINKTIEYFGG